MTTAEQCSQQTAVMSSPLCQLYRSMFHVYSMQLYCVLRSIIYE